MDTCWIRFKPQHCHFPSGTSNQGPEQGMDVGPVSGILWRGLPRVLGRQVRGPLPLLARGVTLQVGLNWAAAVEGGQRWAGSGSFKAAPRPAGSEGVGGDERPRETPRAPGSGQREGSLG